MKKVLKLLCVSLLLGSCMNVANLPEVVETASSSISTEISGVVAESFSTITEKSDLSVAITTVSTISLIDQNETYPWKITGEYFGVDGSVLEIPPESEWYDFYEYYDSENFRTYPNLKSGLYGDKLLIQGSSFIRYPTGIFYDTQRTPELFNDSEFIGEEFRDSETEWVSISVGDKIGVLSISEAEIVYNYYPYTDSFEWHSIDISFLGETELEGVLSSYKSDFEGMYGDGLYFIPFPESLVEQSFPMLKGADGSLWRQFEDGYILGGDTINLSYLSADETLGIKAEEMFNKYGYCKAKVKLSNIHLHAWIENIKHDYCSADLIDFEVVE